MQKVSKEYLLLFNAITDAEESLRRLQARLIDAAAEGRRNFSSQTMKPIRSPETYKAPAGRGRRFTSVRQCLSGVTGFGRQTPLFVAFVRA